jgi:hypothetical protein
VVVGGLDGCPVGNDVGRADGARDGIKLGILLGKDVGKDVGILLEPELAAVGSSVGDTEGS